MNGDFRKIFEAWIKKQSRWISATNKSIKFYGEWWEQLDTRRSASKKKSPFFGIEKDSSFRLCSVDLTHVYWCSFNLERKHFHELAHFAFHMEHKKKHHGMEVENNVWSVRTTRKIVVNRKGFLSKILEELDVSIFNIIEFATSKILASETNTLN